jgi:hypothetical protein
MKSIWPNALAGEGEDPSKTLGLNERAVLLPERAENTTQQRAEFFRA